MGIGLAVCVFLGFIMQIVSKVPYDMRRPSKKWKEQPG